MAKAYWLAVYRDPEYQAALAILGDGVERELLIVEGVSP